MFHFCTLNYIQDIENLVCNKTDWRSWAVRNTFWQKKEILPY